MAILDGQQSVTHSAAPALALAPGLPYLCKIRLGQKLLDNKLGSEQTRQFSRALLQEQQFVRVFADITKAAAFDFGVVNAIVALLTNHGPFSQRIFALIRELTCRIRQAAY
ncbi:MAG: hypothetical protein WBD79_27395 [Anaerolineae bacterium]